MSTRDFTKDALVVLLAAFATIEAASILGVSSSSSSMFMYPVNLTVSGLVVVSSLLGIYGVLSTSRMAAYSSLLAPIVEIISGISFLVAAFGEVGINPALVSQMLLVTLSGIVCVALVSKTLVRSVSAWRASQL